ncbi:hypothetical protein C2G38_2140120 [Gigaspora rosea]|uniref:Uncharacterized protein n=1 Tax=Gigaspora rosea TaxID=44941 RepID=A0A397VLG3_9GLOM|nr:hypothetical protein C2G38_2140120 [Gigaspora rosea]
MTIIGSTFNQKGEIYYMQMDANFVRDKTLYEPLRGIYEGIINYKSKNQPLLSEEAAISLACITKDATLKFEIRSELLTTDGNYQYISINYENNTIRVNKTDPSKDKTTVPGIVSDLNNMIKYKTIITFADGLTNDLDETCGLKPKDDIFGDYKNQIIPFFAIAAVNFVLYTLSQFGGKSESEDLIQMINIATSGLFSATHSSFSSIFAFSDVSSYPPFILPRGGFNELKLTNIIVILLTLYNSETILLINKDKIEKLFDKNFNATAKYRAFADILLKSIPQLVIQILYFELIVTYSIIPFFTLCTTIFMIFLTTVRGIHDLFIEGNKNEEEEKKDEVKGSK